MISLGADPLKVLSWSTLHGWYAVRPAILDGKASGGSLAQAWDGYATQRRVDEFSVGNESQWLAPPGGYNEQKLGVLSPTFAADIIGVCGDLEAGSDAFMRALRNVAFVMQAGKVVIPWNRSEDILRV